MAGPELDVAVIGDGPAGLALAAACAQQGLAVKVVGEDRPWPATYGLWLDDVPWLPELCFAHLAARVVVHGQRRHEIARAYGVVDNEALRGHLGRGVAVTGARADALQHFRWGTRVVAADGDIDARLVVDASGAGGFRRPAPERLTAVQSAYGVVMAAPPGRFDAGAVTLMDLRSVPGTGDPSFCYVVPVADGWLVEETVLAARPPVDPARLQARLVERLAIGRTRMVAEQLVADGGRAELVAIPMGGPLPTARGPVVAFGAAAGYVHPATGFSVAGSLRAVPRVAGAIATAAGRGTGATDPEAIRTAVWPRALRRTRRLHGYGLEVLLGLGPAELATFFDEFFDLPLQQWAGYLRIDTPPAEISATMTTLFRRLPWRMRRRLVVNPLR